MLLKYRRERGMVDKDDAMAQVRLVSLKTLRDQAAADAERTQLALDSSGYQGVTLDMLKGFARKPVNGCASTVAATAAIICARWHSASRWPTTRFVTWDQNRNCCERWSPLQAYC